MTYTKLQQTNVRFTPHVRARIKRYCEQSKFAGYTLNRFLTEAALEKLDREAPEKHKEKK